MRNVVKLKDESDQDFHYRFVHPYVEKINPEDDLVDIEVTLEGDRKVYRGSVTTTRFIDGRMKYYLETGENSDGSYFGARKMVIVRRIDDKTVRKTLKDIIEKRNFEEFFE